MPPLASTAGTSIPTDAPLGSLDGEPNNGWIDAVDPLLTDAVGITLLGALTIALLVLIARQRKLLRDAVTRERHFEMLMRSHPHIVWTATPEGSLTGCNPAGLRWFGVHPRDVTADHWHELIHPDDLPHVGERWQRATETGSTYLNEQRMRRHDGVYEWFRVEAIPTIGKTGRVEGWNGVSTNIQAQKNAESRSDELAAQMQRAQMSDVVALLAGGVAHAINNVLMTIGAASELAEDDVETENGRSLIESIRHATQRGAQITGQLLALNRKQILKPERLDGGEIVRSLAPVLERLLGESIQLVIDDGGAPEIWMDRVQFEQVILNLCVNAKDAMPRGGVLEIGVGTMPPRTADAGAFRMTVADSGTGIPEEIRDRVFEPFFTTKERGSGTGLGLPTVRSIVDEAGGEIGLDSTPGAGTRFTIRIPPAPARTGRQEPTPLSEAPYGQGQLVLLCEDDTDVLRLVSRQLEDGGYRVLACSNADQARSVAERCEDPISLILTDIVLSDADGPALAERLTATRPDLRRLYMTGYPFDVATRHGVRPGDLLLSKPFTKSQLFARVHDALGAPSSGVGAR
jgi:PAS domain S-box-containing protein